MKHFVSITKKGPRKASVDLETLISELLSALTILAPILSLKDNPIILPPEE